MPQEVEQLQTGPVHGTGREGVVYATLLLLTGRRGWQHFLDGSFGGALIEARDDFGCRRPTRAETSGVSRCRLPGGSRSLQVKVRESKIATIRDEKLPFERRSAPSSQLWQVRGVFQVCPVLPSEPAQSAVILFIVYPETFNAESKQR